MCGGIQVDGLMNFQESQTWRLHHKFQQVIFDMGQKKCLEVISSGYAFMVEYDSGSCRDLRRSEDWLLVGQNHTVEIVGFCDFVPHRLWDEVRGSPLPI